MTSPRRTLLRTLGAAALMPDMAGAGLPAAMSPDADLIRDCQRYLDLERVLSDPNHPEAGKDCQDRAEYAEYADLGDAFDDATPRTEAGISALARVALLCIDGQEAAWDDHAALRIAHGLLQRLAGAEASAEAERAASASIARRAAAWASMREHSDPPPAPPRPPKSRNEQITELRNAIGFAEMGAAQMRATLAELEDTTVALVSCDGRRPAEAAPLPPPPKARWT